MGALHVPSKDSVRGKILRTLKTRRAVGASCDELMDEMQASKEVRIQAGIHELRKLGYRIDYDGQRYLFRGTGISHTMVNGKPMVVGSIKLRRQMNRGGTVAGIDGAGIQKSMDRLRVAAERHPSHKPFDGVRLTKPVFQNKGILIPQPQVKTVTPTATKVFSVDSVQLSQALKVVPEGLREELSALATKMERYNAAIELCVKADASLKAILADR